MAKTRNRKVNAVFGWLTLLPGATLALEVPVVGSLDAATASVLETDAGTPVVWDSAQSRGAVLRLERYKDAQGRDCQELGISRLRLKPTRFDETLWVYCRTGGKWERATHDRPDTTQKREAARYFIPPQLDVPSVWRLPDGALRAYSASAAYAFALAKPDIATFHWNTEKSRGVVRTVAMRNDKNEDCRVLVVMRRDDDQTREENAIYCRESVKVPWTATGSSMTNKELASTFNILRKDLVRDTQDIDARSKLTTSPATGRPAPGETPQSVATTPRGESDATSDEATAAPARAAKEQRREAGNAAAARIAPIRVAEACEAGKLTTPGAPWGAAAGKPGSTLPRTEEYRAAVSHGLRNIKLLYGRMTAEQEAGIDRQWAPFFDHPNADALNWFQRANPLLDDYLATLAELDGSFPGFRDATADLMIASATASQSFFDVSAPVAQQLGQRIVAAKRRLDDLTARIAALGDAPNPLAAKCQARARHKKAFGGGGKLLDLIKSTQFLNVNIGKSIGDQFWSEGQAPRIEFKWNDTEFSYRSQTKHFGDPCGSPSGLQFFQYCTDLRGKLTPDGKKVLYVRGTGIERSCRNEKTRAFDSEPTRVAVENATLEKGWETLPLSGTKDLWINYDLPTPADCTGILGKCHYGLAFHSELILSNNPTTPKAERVITTAPANGGPVGCPDIGPTASQGNQDRASPPPQGKPAPAKDDAEAAAIREAITQHEALAKQYEQNAARWVADAGKEKDPVRRDELEKRAAEIAANASAERDIAASLSSGRKELDRFAADKQHLDDIHKVLMMGGGKFSGGMDERISAALKSPNASGELAKINAEVRARVRADKEENLAFREKEKELADWELQRPIAVARGAANMAVAITAMAVPGAGPVAVAWGLGSGYVDGGAKGVAEAGVRMYSPFVDVAMATYEGGSQGGAWGALKGGGTAAFMNAFMTKAGPKLQKAVTQVQPNVPKLTLRKGAVPEVDIHTAEQRYEHAKANAKSPEELAALKQQYATVEQRQQMKHEIKQAVEAADKAAAKARKPDGTVDANHPEYKKAVEQLKAETQKIHEKYAAQENRDQLHAEALKLAGAENVKLSGGMPKNAASDMDVTASSYKAGKDYVSALTKRGLSAVEYGDRWVLSNDVTVWKPGSGAKTGSSAFDAETAFGASRGSDKFATQSGQKYTKGEGSSGDTQGAVIDNIKKAGEANLGTNGPKDMHVIGKSADKALEISGADAPGDLRKTLAGLRNHQPPELAGVVQLGASPAAKAKQTQSFLNQTQKAMAKSFQKATEASWKHEQTLVAQQNAARQKGDMKRVAEIQQELAGSRSSNRVALATVSDVAPELISTMLPPPAASAASGAGGRTAAASTPALGVLLKNDREKEGRNLPPLKGDDPALGDLGERCKEAAKRVDAKLKTTKPGSDEAAYLAQLKGTLEAGGRNPAEAVQNIRSLSGFELAVVLKELGVEPKKF